MWWKIIDASCYYQSMGNKWESNDKYFFKIKGIFIVCNMLPATFDVKYCAINVIYEIVVFIFFLFASMTSFMKDDDGWGRCCQRQLIFLHSQGRWQLLYANSQIVDDNKVVEDSYDFYAEWDGNCLQIQNCWSMSTWKCATLRFKSWNKYLWM